MSLISLRLPYPLCTRFFICYVCVLRLSNAGNLPSAPLPSLHTFYLSCFVCFASLSPVLCSASLFSSPVLHLSLFILLVCLAPKTEQFYFPWDFLFAYAIIGFYSEFVMFPLRSPNFAFPRCIHSDPCPSILYALFVLFFFYALYFFSRIFSPQRVFCLVAFSLPFPLLRGLC